MKVVNLKNEKYTHYIGRGSIFGNPFKIGTDGNRKQVMEEYEQCLRKQIAEFRENRNIKLPKYIYNLPEDAILGCYCKPKACHGDIIIKIWKELHGIK